MSRMRFSGVPPLTRTFRVANINVGSYCASYYVVSATRVYYNGKMAIYEDDATASGFKSVNNAGVAAAYQTMGDEFTADVEPLIRNNFGDILRRDALTDDNGVEVALFTPRINTSFSGVTSFTLTCDQFPNDDVSSPAVGGPYTGSAGSTNGSSNFGEVFYGYEATSAATDFSVGGVPYWTRLMRKEVVHESKHIASYSARVANNAPTYEVGWLEESMSRHAEELWSRAVIDNLAWKSNIGYGSFANPINVYCEARPTAAECNANPRRPAVAPPVWSPLYTEMFGTNARLLSPFGATASDTQRYYYAVAWSLVRYALDHYGSSEPTFLTALTQATTSGVTNLTAQTGTSIDLLLGNWALSFYADDYNAAALGNAAIQMPSWNFRNIYAGMNTDFPATYTLAYPLVPQARSFGTFAPVGVTTMRGGGILWYEITGTQSLGQLLRLETNGGGLPSSALRIAVARLQ